MKKEIRILFTGVGRRVELLQQFRDAAFRLGLNLKIFGSDICRDAPAALFCDEVIETYRMDDERYIGGLLDSCRRDHIDIVIPTIDTDIIQLAQNRQLFEKEHITVLVSDIDVVSICRDKSKVCSFFEQCGLNAPKAVNDIEDYSDLYPAFIKPVNGSGSINAYRADNRAELEIFAKRIDNYVIQPYIDGTEYTIDVFCDLEGKPLSIVPRERVDVRAGEVVKTRICMDNDMISEAGVICSRLKPRGPITIQLIRERESGKNYYIEINPRFGGGAPLSIRAGADSAERLLRIIAGIDTDVVMSANNGALYCRFHQAVCMTDKVMELDNNWTDSLEELVDRYKIEGVIFDLDDTLYDEIEYVKSGYKAVAGYLDNADSAELLMDYYRIDPKPIDLLLREINRQDEKEAVLKVYREHIPDLSLSDKVKGTLDLLHLKGIRTGIITDGRPAGQRNKIAALKLDQFVDDIIITDELGGEQFRKPCDIAFRIIQRRWGVSFEKLAYIGDNITKDFSAPRILGMKAFHYNNPNGIYYL